MFLLGHYLKYHNTAHIKEVCTTLICAYVNILSVSLSAWNDVLRDVS